MASYTERTINDFKSRLAGGGARPNLFEVAMTFPDNLTSSGKELAKTEVSYMVKAAELPASNIGDIPVNFRGRILHVAGDRTFEPWTITVQNDSKFLIRSAFEKWAQAIQAYDENFTSASGLHSPDDKTGYFADMEVHQLSRDDQESGAHKVIKSYKFYNVFPSSIAAIDLDFGNNDAIEEFTVELQTQYWTPIPPKNEK